MSPGVEKRSVWPYPSIFNDVIGPVMRGPSSSHCAAAVRIGRLARDLMDGELCDVRVEFDAAGSLATTHESHGSDMGLFAGLLGWDVSDGRLTEAARAIRDAGIRVEIRISDYDADHPSTYRMTLANATELHEMTALSTGGGAIEVTEIDGAPVSLAGDTYETLVYLGPADPDAVLSDLAARVDADEICLRCGTGVRFVEVKATSFLDDHVASRLRSAYGIDGIKRLSPVLPVLSRKGTHVPFISCQAMLDYNERRQLDLWELAVHYESARGELSEESVFEQMRDIVRILQRSVQEGIQGTEYLDRILGYQSGSIAARMAAGQLLDAGILNPIIKCVTALMEVKSAMGVIVAAPTAGACGALPGACIGAAGAMGLSVDDITRAMLAAGMIGVFIAAHATFAAEVGGCQAECGAASGMAAAALVTLAGGTLGQALGAASMALQNVLGMVCDPVANRVEVPCLGKNLLAASNALACANMALADLDPVIPLDEVIEAMDQVGRSLPRELRCTGLGGLSVTPTSRSIEKRLGRSSS